MSGLEPFRLDLFWVREQKNLTNLTLKGRTFRDDIITFYKLVLLIGQKIFTIKVAILS